MSDEDVQAMAAERDHSFREDAPLMSAAARESHPRGRQGGALEHSVRR
jgi:hypothetical protein